MRKVLLAISALLWCGASNAITNVSYLNFRKRQGVNNVDEKLILRESSSVDSYWVKGSDSHGSHMSHRSHYSHYSSTIVSSTHDSIQAVTKSQKAWIIKNMAKDNGVRESDIKLKHVYFAKNCSVSKDRDGLNPIKEKETIPNDTRVLYCEVDFGHYVLQYIIPFKGKYKVHVFNKSGGYSQEIRPWMKETLSK